MALTNMKLNPEMGHQFNKHVPQKENPPSTKVQLLGGCHCGGLRVDLEGNSSNSGLEHGQSPDLCHIMLPSECWGPAAAAQMRGLEWIWQVGGRKVWGKRGQGHGNVVALAD